MIIFGFGMYLVDSKTYEMHFGTVERSGFFVLLLLHYLRYIQKVKV